MGLPLVYATLGLLEIIQVIFSLFFIVLATLKISYFLIQLCKKQVQSFALFTNQQMFMIATRFEIVISWIA
jgi:hypothetical protein